MVWPGKRLQTSDCFYVFDVCAHLCVSALLVTKARVARFFCLNVRDLLLPYVVNKASSRTVLRIRDFENRLCCAVIRCPIRFQGTRCTRYRMFRQ